MSQEPTEVQDINNEDTTKKSTDQIMGRKEKLGCFFLLLPFAAFIISAFAGYGLMGVLGFSSWLPNQYWDATIVIDSVAPLPDMGALDKSALLDEYPLGDWDNTAKRTRSINARFLQSEIDSSHIALLTIDATTYSSISDSNYIPPVVKGDTLHVRLDYNDTGLIPFNAMFRDRFGFHIAEIKNVKQIYAKHGQLDNMDIHDETSASGRFWILSGIGVIGCIVFMSIRKRFRKKNPPSIK